MSYQEQQVISDFATQLLIWIAIIGFLISITLPFLIEWRERK